MNFYTRCFAHILNLIVSDELKELTNAILKIRNALRFVRSSPHSLERFKTCVKDAKLEHKSLVCLDVLTRWNSTYLMLEAAEKFEIAFERLYDRELSFRSYFKEGEGGKNISGPPAYSDWEDARRLVKFLRIFYIATLKFSGSLYVTSNVFFQELVTIQTKLITYKRSLDVGLICMARRMQEKFEKYWDVEKINLLLFVALVLDPRFKMKYVRFCLSSKLEFEISKVDLISSRAKDTLVRLHDWHLGKYTSLQHQNIGESSQGLRSEGDDYEEDDGMSLADEFEKHLEEKDNLVSKSEVERYLAESQKNGHLDILDWWKSNSSRYRILSFVARDVLAIPASSVALESAFSTGGRILDCFRSSLAPTTVEALVCAQDWLRPSMVPIDIRESMDEVEKLEQLDKEMLGGSLLHPSFIED